MSYYLVCSLTTLGFSGILTGGMIIAFEGMERQTWKRGVVLPGALHLLAGLFTLINFIQGGCVISVPLILIEGICVSSFAGKVWWKCTDPREQQSQHGNSIERRGGSSGRHAANGSGSADAVDSDLTRSPRPREAGAASSPQHLD